MDQLSRRAGLDIEHPNLRRAFTEISFTPPTLSFAIEENFFAIVRQRRIRGRIVQQNFFCRSLRQVDLHHTLRTAPEVIALSDRQDTITVRKPICDGITFGVKCLLFGDSTLSGHYIDLVRTRSIANEGDLRAIGRESRLRV